MPGYFDEVEKNLYTMRRNGHMRKHMPKLHSPKWSRLDKIHKPVKGLCRRR